jgi:DNA-directed RNA polymerase subunit L
VKLLLIFFLTLSLYAGQDDKKAYHINKDLTHLNLSQEQNEAMKKVLKKYQHEIEEFREFKEKINAKKQKLFLEESLDVEALGKLNHELYEKANKEEKTLLSRLHALLSPEQRVQFIRYFEEWEIK